MKNHIKGGDIMNFNMFQPKYILASKPSTNKPSFAKIKTKFNKVTKIKN